MKRGINITAGLLGLLLAGCENGALTEEASGKAETRTYNIGAPATAAEIARIDIDVRPDGSGLPPGSGNAPTGKALYLDKCAHCHGETGREGPFDVLAGRLPEGVFPFAEDPKAVQTIGNYWPYATTLFDYIRRAMPSDNPGSLTDEEVYALTAYLLAMNDIVAEDAVLTAENLPQITMPAAKYFYSAQDEGQAYE